MRVLFHLKAYLPRYHRGTELQNGRFYESDCGAIKGAPATSVVVVGREYDEVSLRIVQLCGNCFRQLRKMKVVIDASGVSE